MFEAFKEIDEKQEFEILANGFVLRVNGRDKDENWFNASYIFTTDTALFSALAELAKLR